MAETIRLVCPQCGRFLAEVSEYAKLPCPTCGTEVTYKSRAFRKTEATPGPVAWSPGVEVRKA